MSEAKRLLLEIAYCPRLADARAGKNECAAIVSEQDTEGMRGLHLPEPWNGRIEMAPLLFLSSNPSIGEQELFPTFEPRWNDDETAEFFEGRFGFDASSPISAETFRSLDQERSPKRLHSIHHLRRLQELGEGLYGSGRDVVAGVDYAVAEVVHCKSRGEKGVPQARPHCERLYLGRLLGASGARLIVVLGGHARESVRKHIGIERPGWDSVHALKIGEREQVFLFRKHPSAWGARTPLAESLAASELSAIRKLLTA